MKHLITPCNSCAYQDIGCYTVKAVSHMLSSLASNVERQLLDKQASLRIQVDIETCPNYMRKEVAKHG